MTLGLSLKFFLALVPEICVFEGSGLGLGLVLLLVLGFGLILSK